MSYASENDDAEQVAQGEEFGHGEPNCELSKMLRYHGIDLEDWARLSLSEQNNYRWNYRQFGRKK